MLNLAHMLSDDARARGTARAKELGLPKEDGSVVCTAEDFVRILFEHRFLLCSDGRVKVLGDVIFNGSKQSNIQFDIRIPCVHIIGSLRFSEMVFQGKLDLSLVSIKGSLQFLNVVIGGDLIVPNNAEDSILIRGKNLYCENLKVNGKKLKVVEF